MTTPEGKRAEVKILKHRYDNRRFTDDERERASFTCQRKKRDKTTLKMVPLLGYFGLKTSPTTVYEVTARCTPHCDAWKRKDSVRKWEPCYRQGQQHFEFYCPRCLKYHKVKQQVRELA